MATNAQNIIVGAAAVAVGTGTATSAGVTATWDALKTEVGVGKDYRGWIAGLTSVGTAVNGVTFKDAGLTQNGVEVTYTPDYGEVEVDQVLDAAKIFKQKMSVMVRTTFAEATLENLYQVWGQSDATIATVGSDEELFLVPGELGQAPVEKHLLFVGSSTADFDQRVYLVSRAVSMEASVHSLRRNEATVFPVAFRLLPDTSSSYSAYGKVIDVA